MLDVSLFKNDAITERTAICNSRGVFQCAEPCEFRDAERDVFSGDAINPSAGLITSTTTTSRQIQFGMKLVF